MIRNNVSNIFLNKKILIYGLGKCGLSTYNFLKNKSKIYLYDDFQKNNKLINYELLLKKKFDYIIISPGIDINKCKLSNYLKKNLKKIYSDLDIFYSFYKNDCITITGTNGKSTTCQLLFEVLSKQKYDVRLVGNIGNPILSVKGVKPKTIFVVEASSYQLKYSRIFKTKYAAILNISPDHIERHKTFRKYIKAKLRLFENQSKNSYAFIKQNDSLIKKELDIKKLSCKLIKIKIDKSDKIYKKFKNEYFISEANKENLAFVLSIAKKLNLNKNLMFKTIQRFKGLKYRQQIILNKSKLLIINDSKSTSFSSSVGLLKLYPNIFWLLGGVYKKGDKFDIPKKYHHKIKAFIYGRNRNFFNNQLKGKIKYENFDNLEKAFKKILSIIKKQKFSHKTILFSPSAASFDSFKNFEDRGFYFNKMVKSYFNG